MASFLRCPAQFCDFRPKILTPCLNRMCKHTESLPEKFFFFFQRSYRRFYLSYFGSYYRLYLEQRKKKRGQSFFLLVGVWWTPRQKKTSKFIILSGAWPIYRSGNTFASPAPIDSTYPWELAIHITPKTCEYPLYTRKSPGRMQHGLCMKHRQCFVKST